MEGSGSGLYRIEVVVGKGARGAKILNHPVPPAFRESVKVGEQNLYAAGSALVGDRDPRGHQYTIQMQPRDNERSGAGLGLPVLAALVGGLLERRTRGATIIAGRQRARLHRFDQNRYVRARYDLGDDLGY